MKKLNLLLILVVVVGISLVAYTVSATVDSTPSFEVSDNPSGGPIVVSDLSVTPSSVGQNEEVVFTVGIEDVSGVKTSQIQIKNSRGTLVGTIILYDNGISGGDVTEDDGIYSGLWNSGNKAADIYTLAVKMEDRLGNYNVDFSNSRVEITSPSVNTNSGGPTGCTVDTDCGVSSFDRCCGTTCSVDECVLDSECVDGSNGVCNQGLCPSVCEYSAANGVPVITSTLNAFGEEGTAFSYTIVADNSPTSYSAVGLPSSLSIDESGFISGTPVVGDSSTSPYSVSISATNGAGTDIQVLLLNITPQADTVSPVVNITSPGDLEVVNNNIIIVKATATDNVSVVSVDFYIDGVYSSTQYFEYNPLTNPNEYWQTMTISPGVHDIKVVAYDDWDNMAEHSVRVEYQQAGSAPVINQFIDADATGVQHVGDYDNADTIKFRVDSSDDSKVMSVELYKNGGSGTLAVSTPSSPSADYLITFNVGASTLTYLEQAIIKYVDESSTFKLPFISVANAATGNQNCTTTTTTRDRQGYAVVYDDSQLSTTSGMVNVKINTTSTSCTGSGGSTGGGE